MSFDLFNKDNNSVPETDAPKEKPGEATAETPMAVSKNKPKRRYYLRKDSACNYAAPMDYNTLLDEFDQLLEQPSTFGSSSFEGFKARMQYYYQFMLRRDLKSQNMRFHFILPQKKRVWHRIKRGLLIYYVNGKEICSVSENANENEMKVFESQIHQYLRQEITKFIKLSEKEKTVWLLKCLGITVLFAQKGHSWISKPNVWVLSQMAHFEQINRVILEDFCELYNLGLRDNLNWFTRSLTMGLPILIFYLLGIPVREINNKIWKNYRTIPFFFMGLCAHKTNYLFYNEKLEAICDDICFFAGFAKRKILLHRFFKSNSHSRDEINFDFEPYKQKWQFRIRKMRGEYIMTLTVYASLFYRETHPPPPLTWNGRYLDHVNV